MSLVLYEKKGRIGYVTYNRPEVLNAYDSNLLLEAEKVWSEFRDDPDVWVAILTGAGDRAFCSGADVKEQPTMMNLNIRRFDSGSLEVDKPVIAAVHGWATGGGCTLAGVCDIRIAADNAKFGLLQPQIGAMSDVGASLLPRMMPYAMAMEILLMGRIIDAQEAYRIGFVNKVVPRAQLMQTATEWAERMCQWGGPLAIRLSREVARRSFDMSRLDGVRLGHVLQEWLFKSEDYQEGCQAFREKRKPVWKGR